ncbi:MAG: VRR-NUC domain-containing protein [Gemmatimonadaceae bacterium]
MTARMSRKELAVALGPNSPLRGRTSRNASPEHDEQVKLFEWARPRDVFGHPNYKISYELAGAGARLHPVLGTSLFHAVPNGGKRGKLTAWKLQLEGVTPGVFDIALDMACGGYFGFKLEMKVKGGRLSAAQRDYDIWVRMRGYCTAVCHSWEEARDALLEYLALPPTEALRPFTSLKDF